MPALAFARLRRVRKDRAADDKHGAHQTDRCYGFAQKDGREHDRRKRLEVADGGDGLDGQFGDGAKVEQAADAGVDDAEHDDARQSILVATPADRNEGAPA